MPDPKAPAASASAKAAAAVRPAKPARVRLKVRAIKDGYYDDKLRRVGDVFTIVGELPTPEQIEKGRDPKLPMMFSKIWMERVDPNTPERITSNNEVLRQHHDAVQRAKLDGVGPDNPEGTPDVLGAGDDDIVDV